MAFAVIGVVLGWLGNAAVLGVRIERALTLMESLDARLERLEKLADAEALHFHRRKDDEK